MALLFLSAEGAIAHASGVPQYRQPEIPAKECAPAAGSSTAVDRSRRARVTVALALYYIVPKVSDDFTVGCPAYGAGVLESTV